MTEEERKSTEEFRALCVSGLSNAEHTLEVLAKYPDSDIDIKVFEDLRDTYIYTLGEIDKQLGVVHG